MDIQLIIVILIFAASGVFLIRRMILLFRGKKKAGCEKCGITEEPGKIK